MTNYKIHKIVITRLSQEKKRQEQINPICLFRVDGYTFDQDGRLAVGCRYDATSEQDAANAVRSLLDSKRR